MRQAAGFPCPCPGDTIDLVVLPKDHVAHEGKCGYSKLSEIMSDDVVHIVELKCWQCRYRYAIESSFPSGEFKGGGAFLG